MIWDLGFARETLPDELLLELDPTAQPFLLDYRTEDAAVWPGVSGMEAFAEIAAAVLPDWHVVSLEEVEFRAPFKFYRNESRILILTLALRGDGGNILATCRLIGRWLLGRGQHLEETLHLDGRIRLSRHPRPGRPIGSEP